MTILFCVSSIGDTDLALQTAKQLRAQGYATAFLPLSKAAEERVDRAATLAPITKISLPDIINVAQMPAQRCTNKQIQRIVRFIHQQRFTHMYIGLASERNQEIALQIAENIHHIPVLLASEFMFKPHVEHSIWRHISKLNSNPKLSWAVPLKNSENHFGLESTRTHYIGHLSIDRALQPITENILALRSELGVKAEEKLAVISSTTQPIQCDVDFLKTVLNELPQHPKIQARLSLHPGIKDLDAYLVAIGHLYLAQGAPERFQIILPPSWVKKLKHPELHIHKPEYAALFLNKEVNGPQAAAAADMGLQAVSGALINEAVVRGKPVHTGGTADETPCLPMERYASTPGILFSSKDLSKMEKHELGLSDETVDQACVRAILRR